MEIITELNNKDFYFLEVPEIYSNFKIMQYGYAGTHIMETDTKGLNHWKIKIPNGDYDILGFTKDLIIEVPLKNKNFVLRKS